MGVHPDVQRERDAGVTWWKSTGNGLKLDKSNISKVRDSPECQQGEKKVWPSDSDTRGAKAKPKKES